MHLAHRYSYDNNNDNNALYATLCVLCTYLLKIPTPDAQRFTNENKNSYIENPKNYYTLMINRCKQRS